MIKTVSSTRKAVRREAGYTLIELIVAIGLFATIMLLASGAYFMMINLNRHAQSIATGIDNLSFALETMTRDIRTGTNYSAGASTFSFTDKDGASVTYSLSSGSSGTLRTLQKTVGTGAPIILTDPSVDITELTFDLVGALKNDQLQPRVTIIVEGSVPSGPGKTQTFNIETGATMRGSDL